MGQLKKTGQAGTLESNDILVTVAPASYGCGIAVELVSPVIKQYGEHIKAVIKEIILACGVQDAQVHANDKGALDCTIKARVETAVYRAIAEEVEL